MYILEVIEPLPIDFLSWKTVLFLLAFYVYGSIPFAFLFTFLFTKKKLNETGTGNIGVANAFGVGGFAPGFLTVAGDASKGILPILVSHFFYNGSLVMSLIFIAVGIIGHGYSFFLKGRGGQGGTILMWALLILSPYTFLLYLFVTVLLYVLIRRRRLANSLGYIFLPLELLLIEQNIAFIAFGAFAAIYYIVRYNPQQSDYDYYKSKMRFLRLFAEKLGEKPSLLIPLTSIKNTSRVGFKAYSLCLLEKFGLSVPETYVCPFSIYKRYRENDLNVIQELREDLHHIIKGNSIYSVRSSANLEDTDDHSFAGQFSSYLNVKTVEDVINAIVNVWNSIQSEHLNSYLRAINKTQADLQIAVIIQEMVHSRFSGIVFTRNPITGFDEVIVEAVSGLGDRLNQPGAVLERWVYKWGNWLETPKDTLIDEEVLTKLISEARIIAKKYGNAVDLEWAYDGETVFWLQLRPITSLQGLNIYSNKIAKEFLPGMIKPLVWSINIPVVNSSWKRLLVGLIGKDAENIQIHSLAKPFYYRAYFNMGIMGDMFELLGMPRELLELLIGLEIEKEESPRFRPGIKSMKYMPRLLFMLISSLFFKKKTNMFLKEYDVFYRNIESRVGYLEDESSLLSAVDQLIAASKNASYFVIVTVLLMGLYNRLFKTMLKRYNIEVSTINYKKDTSTLKDIDPNYHLKKLHSLYKTLSNDEKEKFQYGRTTVKEGRGVFQEMLEEFSKFLKTFGHLSESGNDFSKIQWKEKPELIRTMIVDFRDVLEKADGDSEISLSDLPRNPVLRFLYRNALEYQEYRERVNYLYTYGYSLFRQHFLILGSLWKGNKYINNKEDIFYLTYDEIIEFHQNRLSFEIVRDRIAQRRGELLRFQDLHLPTIIVGDSLPLEIPGKNILKILRGVPASKGYCTGKITLIRDIEDFPKAKEGDILVIPYSDVSWTPLFIRAKGVISESGGMLSHSSIMAREYSIPAVVSVPEALNLIEGTLVALDGEKGEVLILD